MNSKAKIVLVASILIIAVFVSLGLTKAQESPLTNRLNSTLASITSILQQLAAAVLDLQTETERLSTDSTSKTTPTTIQQPTISSQSVDQLNDQNTISGSCPNVSCGSREKIFAFGESISEIVARFIVVENCKSIYVRRPHYDGRGRFDYCFRTLRDFYLEGEDAG